MPRQYNEIQSELFFFWIFMIIIFSWIAVDYTARFINNLTFYTLGMNEKSTWHTFIIAGTLIAIIFTCIIFLKTLGYNLEPNVCRDEIIEESVVESPLPIFSPINFIESF